MSHRIHTGIGVYPNGQWVVNGVHSDDLDGHIDYNRRLRPGRALVIDGVTVLPGIGVSDKVIQAAIAAAPVQTRCTAPYR